MPMFDKLDPSSAPPPKKEKKEESAEIDVSEIQGEKGTGFEERIVDGVDKGPFECHNCKYMEKDGDGCEQKIMKAKSKRPRNAKGLPIVGKYDCCEYVHRIGKAPEEKKDAKSEKVEKGAASVSGKAA